MTTMTIHAALAAKLGREPTPAELKADIHRIIAEGQRYNAIAVDNAIAASNRHGRKISGREAKMIHALLKGRT
jgi:hypothetical protein